MQQQMQRLLEKLGPPKWPMREGKNRMLLARIYVCHQRDHLMRAASNLMESHRRRVSFGLKGTLTADQIQDLWDYMDALRDLDKQVGFPYTVTYPKAPEILSRVIVE